MFTGLECGACDVAALCPLGSPAELEIAPGDVPVDVNDTPVPADDEMDVVDVYWPYLISTLVVVGVGLVLLAVSPKLPAALKMADLFPLDHAVEDGDSPRKLHTVHGAAFTLVTLGLLAIVAAVLVVQNAPVTSHDLASVQVRLLPSLVHSPAFPRPASSLSLTPNVAP
jgi:hypothetical protein